ncbi:LysR family transcriptional regulator [Ralstonia mojiangensis]|uniref:LysR family transcriptional regulator n=1 Tax=Ralstonia mojiangensis TaxID=2953895 RepID=UPI0021B418DD|nr:LysR family transcriptional regulator [Ralstonia mojiangensis]MCT7326290.1 LysR family transcriptional regulator [Ralstonia mojiangensis]
MLDNLPALISFARIVSAGSLSGAAREMDLPLSVVSKRLAQLEAALGVRLIQRTTRRQTLTEEGVLFHSRVVRILDEIEQAESLLMQRRQAVSGLLRVTAPGQLGRRRIAPIVAAFQREHPQLSVQLELTDAVVDLIDSGYDMAIRFGALTDSTLIARPLAPNFRVLCASPDYLAEHGAPVHPADLVRHRCILIGDQRRADWRFSGGEEHTVRVTASIVTNDGEAAHALAAEGAGIAVKSIWDVGDDLLAGRLVRVLPGHSVSAAPLHAIYPHSQHLAPRVRVFVDYVRDRLQQDWRWDAL